MKKLFAVLLTACLLLALSACGGGDAQGIAITNNLGCNVVSIQISPDGVEGWGDNLTGFVDAGVGAYIYPQEVFGASKVDASVLVIDEFDNYYGFDGVTLADGDSFEVKTDGEGDVLLIKNDGDDLFIGDITEGDPWVELENWLDLALAEVYIYANDSGDMGEPVITGLESLDTAEISLRDLFGSPGVAVHVDIVDEEGNHYRFSNVSLREGCCYDINLDENDKLILENTTHGGIYEAQLVAQASTDRLMSDLEGMWEFSRDEMFILFYSDLTWDTVSFEGQITDSGEYDFFGQEVTVYSGGEEIIFAWDADGDLYCQDEDLLLSFVCSFDSEEYQQFRDYVQSQQCFFETRGYEINYVLDQGFVFLEDSAAVIVGDGDKYARMPSMFCIELQRYVDNGDGTVDIQFVKTTYLDAESWPDIVKGSGSYMAAVNTALCDYYTGQVFQTSGQVGQDAEENRYSYEYESQGRTIQIEYVFINEVSRTADGGATLSTTIAIQMPADYDGIIYVVGEAYPDYETFAEAYYSDRGDEVVRLRDEDVENAFFCCLNPLG